MGDLLDVFYFVEGEVEGCEVGKLFQATNVCDEVIVEIEFGKGSGQRGQPFDFGDAVLAEAEACYGVEAGEVEGGEGGDAGVY